MSEILWRPSPERIAASNLAAFARRLGFDPIDYPTLWRWSIEHRGEFWQAVWDDGGVIASHRADRPVGVEAMPGTEWFPGARLNYAENLLRRADDAPAIVFASEDAAPAEMTWWELRDGVARARRGLQRLGVGVGDRVAALLPNGPEAVTGLLATASLGAVWSSCSPDFGPLGVIDRFGQIEPKVLLTVAGYRYQGRQHDITSTVARATATIASIEQVVVVGEAAPALPAAMPWDALLAEGAPLEFTQLPFDHPLAILYSSGTTGRPKSLVHGAGGTLLKHLSELRLHSDLKAGDRLFWFTTCGWMMWNWLVSGLAVGATIVLYDGSPSHPSLERLWRLAGDTGITHFGVSPRFLAANANAGIVPGKVADLSAMRFLGSTGAPLNPGQFDWVYANVASDVQLASISGGSDIVGCFALGVPTLPVRRGELQARALGAAVESWDASGRPVVGEKGDLVCTRPLVSMPVGFWGDPDGARYRQAYFAEHPGTWTHGDFIEIRPEGGVVIYGRSDTTLNPGGVRIGTAEIYRAVETMPEIADSIAVGHDTGGDVEVVLFVVASPGVVLDDHLIARIKDRIRTETSPRHVPRRVLAVQAVPYTISGKKVEKAVRAIVAGETVTDRAALANPEALEEYAGRV
ncbi:MAG: acetoacetate--CoA ligase [Acidimicrobiia bacterium]|nr:acetoacetate--CoA ligase [Acidimicrobiia bacterium]